MPKFLNTISGSDAQFTNETVSYITCSGAVRAASYSIAGTNLIDASRNANLAAVTCSSITSSGTIQGNAYNIGATAIVDSSRNANFAIVTASSVSSSGLIRGTGASFSGAVTGTEWTGSGAVRGASYSLGATNLIDASRNCNFAIVSASSISSSGLIRGTGMSLSGAMTGTAITLSGALNAANISGSGLTLSGAFLPDASGTIDIGTTSLRIRTIYCDTISANFGAGGTTVLSGITIDANKDWAAKSITNLATLSCTYLTSSGDIFASNGLAGGTISVGTVLLPFTSGSKDIGTSALAFRTLYVNTVSATGVTASGPINCGNLSSSGITSSGTILPATSGSIDIGTTSLRIRTIYCDTMSALSGAGGIAGSTTSLNFVIDGGGAVISTGSKGYVELPFAGTVSAWTCLANESGSIVVDVKKCTYAAFPTLSSIAGTEKPTITTATKSQDTSLTSFTTGITAGDIWEFNVDSVTNIKRCTVAFKIIRS